MSNRFIATFLVTVISILFSILTMFYACDLLLIFGDMTTKPALATTLTIIIIVIAAIIIILSIATLLAAQSANPDTFKILKIFNDYSFAILILLLLFLSITYSTQLSVDTTSIEKNMTINKSLTESLCNSLLLIALPKILLFSIISTLCNISVYFICLIDYRIDVEIPGIVQEKIRIKQASKPKVQQKTTENSLEKEIKVLEEKLKQKELKNKYDSLLKKLEDDK